MLELNLHPNPKKAVYSRISKPVRKAEYLFALCENNPLYSKHKQLLDGVLDMLGGLEYHIKNMRPYENAARRFMTNLLALSKTKEPFNIADLLKRANHHPAVPDSPVKKELLTK